MAFTRGLTCRLLACLCLVAGAAWGQQPQVRCERPPVSRPPGAGAAAGQYEPTVQDYEEALRREPRTAQDYTQVILLAPRNPPAHYGRGLARARLGDPKGAVEDFSEAILRNAAFAAAYRNRGMVYAKLGEPQRALADLESALRLDAGDALGFAEFERTHGAKARERLRGYREGRPYRAP